MNFSKLKFLLTDFDGVLTDGSVFIDDSGRESVKCSRFDGLGVRILKKYGVQIFILSSETSQVVEFRARKMKIEFATGIEDKLKFANELVNARGINPESLGFVGDELNDVALLNNVRFSFCPSTACKEVKEIASIHLKSGGGQGVLKEIASLVLPNASW